MLTDQMAPEGADIKTVLDAVHAVFTRHFLLKAHERDALTLWTAHTYLLEAADNTPRLFLWSASHGSGKTSVLEVLELLARNATLESNPTPSTVFRSIEDAPTLLLDEADKWLPKNLDVLSVLNVGYKRAGKVPRSVPTQDGKNWEIKRFPVFAPVALAAKTRKLPADLLARSIKISLIRAKRGEVLEPFSCRKHGALMAELSERLAAASAGVLEQLQDLPEIGWPDWIPDGRTWDIWYPLFAIAQVAGGDWPDRVQNASRLLTGMSSDELDVQERILHDIHVLWARQEWGEQMHSDCIVSMLNGDEDLLWRRWNNGQGMDRGDLNKMLKNHDIHPEKDPFRVPGSGTGRGFKRASFATAWDRFGIEAEPCHALAA